MIEKEINVTVRKKVKLVGGVKDIVRGKYYKSISGNSIYKAVYKTDIQAVFLKLSDKRMYIKNDAIFSKYLYSPISDDDAMIEML